MRIRICWFVLLSSFLCSFFSPPAFASDLLQLYREALQNDPVYNSARSTLAAGQEKYPQGRSLLLPTVSLTGSNTKSNTDFSSDSRTVDGVKGFSNSYNLQLTQPLINWDRWQQFEQSKLEVLVSEAQFNQAQLDLIVRVAQSYFDVLYAQDVLDALRANKEALAVQLAYDQRKYELGTTTIVDQQDTQSRYDLAVAKELGAENDLEAKRAAIEQIVGHAPGGLLPLKKGVQLTAPQPLKIDEWVSSAEQNNYDVVGAKFSQEIARRAISKNRAGHLPTLDFVANVTRSGTSAIPVDQIPAITQTSRNIGIQLTVPLFSGFAVTSKVREAIALEDKAGNDYINAKRKAVLAARQAYLGVNSALAQVKAFEMAEVSSQTSLDSTKLGLDVGVRVNIDVLNAQQQLYTTRQDLAKARYDAIMQGLRLKFASASLSEDDLVQVNGLLH